MTEELIKAGAMLRRILERQKAAQRAARYYPSGKLLPRGSSNAAIRRGALVCEPIPGGEAEIWITYTGGREEYLAMQDDPIIKHLTELPKLMDPEALNGYVAFPKRHAPRLPFNTTGKIIQYIPVHGGVTWARKDSFAAAWGFDTMHANSEKQPRTDRDWIRANCWVLYRGLLLAEQLWPEFRRATPERRADLAQKILDLIEEQPLMEKLGFEALISTITGRVG